MAMSCKVCTNETVRSQVDRMISEGVSDEGISRALASVGADIGKSSILRHRTNHYRDDADHSGVELPPDMEVPKPNRVEFGAAIGDDATTLLEQTRDEVRNGGSPDFTSDRVVRERLLARIYESQLAITAASLDRFRTGDGRYPLDMVKGLQTVAGLFEKTDLHQASGPGSKETLFETEMVRREQLAYDEAKELAIAGAKGIAGASVEHLRPWKPPTLYSNAGYEKFSYADCVLSGDDYNRRIDDAWNRGVVDGRKIRKQIQQAEKNDVEA